jgi:hypothetical protein
MLIQIKASVRELFSNECLQKREDALMSVIAPQDTSRCAHCGTMLSLPEWSERVSENETTHFWRPNLVVE